MEDNETPQRSSNIGLVQFYQEHRAEIDIISDEGYLFVLTFVARVSPISVLALARRLGWEVSAVKVICRALIDKGMISGVIEGRVTTIQLTEAGSTLLKTYFGDIPGQRKDSHTPLNRENTIRIRGTDGEGQYHFIDFLEGDDTSELGEEVQVLDLQAKWQVAELSTALHQDARLTDRQKDVLQLLFNGTKRKDISIQLSVAASTVDKHLYDIYRRLGVTSIAEALSEVLRAYELGNSSRR